MILRLPRPVRCPEPTTDPPRPKAAHSQGWLLGAEFDVGRLSELSSEAICTPRYEVQRLGPREVDPQPMPLSQRLAKILAGASQGQTASLTQEVCNKLEGECSEDGGCSDPFTEQASMEAGSAVRHYVQPLRWPATSCPALSSAQTSYSGFSYSEATVARMDQSFRSTSRRQRLLPSVVNLHQLSGKVGSPAQRRVLSPRKPRALRHSPMRPRSGTHSREVPSTCVKTDLDCCGRRLSMTASASPTFIL